MENNMSTLRLIYPHWMPDIIADDVLTGYYLGAQLLKLLAPESSQNSVEVPVSLDVNDSETDKGVSVVSKEEILPSYGRLNDRYV